MRHPVPMLISLYLVARRTVIRPEHTRSFVEHLAINISGTA